MTILNYAGQRFKDQSDDDLKIWLEGMEKRLEERIRESEGRLSSKMRDLEANVRDISSITHAVRRMNVGFQEIPYEMNGGSAVEKIKDYY